MIYVTAPSKEQILRSWYEIYKEIPVNWKDKESIKKFKTACDKYSKAWDKLDYEEQGWICEKIMEGEPGQG